MTDVDIAELRRLCDEATPGPWTADIDTDPAAVHQVYGADLHKVIQAASRKPDATFIARARAAVPALLDELERLRGENQLMRAHEGLHAAARVTIDAELFTVREENDRLHAELASLRVRLAKVEPVVARAVAFVQLRPVVAPVLSPWAADKWRELEYAVDALQSDEGAK